jgi:hypothetical protein
VNLRNRAQEIAEEYEEYERSAEREIEILRSGQVEGGIVPRRQIGLGMVIVAFVIGILVLLVKMK